MLWPNGELSINKTCKAIVSVNKQPERMATELIITSFVRVVYPLKYPSNACVYLLRQTISGSCCWNAIYLVSKCHTNTTCK